MTLSSNVTYYSSSSSDSSNDEDLSSIDESSSSEEEELHHQQQSSIRRRHVFVAAVVATETKDNKTLKTSNSSGSSKSKKKKRRSHNNDFCASTACLFLSALVWVVCQMYLYFLLFPLDHPRPTRTAAPHEHLTNRKDLEKLRQLRIEEAERALGSAASHNFGKNKILLHKNKYNSRKGKVNNEKEEENGCVQPPWQRLHFPTCNKIHEIDLQRDFQMTRGMKKLPTMGLVDSFSDSTVIQKEEQAYRKEIFSAQNRNFQGYLGSGLWRNVWKIRSFSHFAVVKMMKMDHEVDERKSFYVQRCPTLCYWNAFFTLFLLFLLRKFGSP